MPRVRFESKAARHRLKTAEHDIQFTPGPKRNEAGDQFGLFETEDPKVIEFVRNSIAYKGGRPGRKGVWEEGARVEAETQISQGTARSAVVRGMTEAQLRGVIAASEVAVPGEGVKIEALQRIAEECLAGRLKPGDEPVVEEEAESEEGSKAGAGKTGPKGAKGAGGKGPKK